MSKQLKYFQEDVILALDTIILTLAVGFDFSAWACWLIFAFVVMQAIKATRACMAWIREQETAGLTTETQRHGENSRRV